MTKDPAIETNPTQRFFYEINFGNDWRKCATASLRHRGALPIQEQVHLLRCLQGGVPHDAYRVDEEEFVGSD
uniref:hypothetical protein n=1 Tax=Algoriphagus sp. TaxID=1872435 RepID=UPI004048DDE5